MHIFTAVMCEDTDSRLSHPLLPTLTRNLYVRSSSSSERASFLRLLSSTIRSEKSFSLGCWFLPGDKARSQQTFDTGFQKSELHHHRQCDYLYYNFTHHYIALLVVFFEICLDLMGLAGYELETGLCPVSDEFHIFFFLLTSQ